MLYDVNTKPAIELDDQYVGTGLSSDVIAATLADIEQLHERNKGWRARMDEVRAVQDHPVLRVA